MVRVRLLGKERGEVSFLESFNRRDYVDGIQV
jgi:hypothetical protein